MDGSESGPDPYLSFRLDPDPFKTNMVSDLEHCLDFYPTNFGKLFGWAEERVRHCVEKTDKMGHKLEAICSNLNSVRQGPHQQAGYPPRNLLLHENADILLLQRSRIYIPFQARLDNR